MLEIGKAVVWRWMNLVYLHVLGGAAMDGEEAAEGLGLFVEGVEAALAVASETDSGEHNAGKARLGDGAPHLLSASLDVGEGDEGDSLELGADAEPFVGYPAVVGVGEGFEVVGVPYGAVG